MSAQKTKPSLLCVGVGYAAFALALPIDFYGVARIHIFTATIMVLVLGLRALLIDLGQVRADNDDIQRLKSVFPVWFISAAACCVTIILQHPVFSGMPYLLTVYRVVCIIGYGSWGASLAAVRRMCDAI